jgi:GTP-binding protein
MQLRNIAIIAHVDHGKTTLVDTMMQQSGAFRANQNVAERAMDSGELERERGITILAKCTSVEWKDTRINIVDTPGHADFGGEVERILSMVDGVVLLVDAAEGPMPQTKFVTAKALKLGLKPIVVVNKVDKPDARSYDVQTEVFDLFSALDANDEQLDFPTLFASGRDGWASDEPDSHGDDLSPLFESIIKNVAAPDADENGLFSMLVTTIEADPYLGRILTGRIFSGSVIPNQVIKALNAKNEVIDQGRVQKILAFRDVTRESLDIGIAGDIVAIAGMTKATVADTLCATEVTEAIQAQPVDPPTLAMTFSVNTSPFVGQDGSKVTSRMIRERLMRESEGNVAIKITETENNDAFDVAGRGELQLGDLIEQMRREGYELSISRPRVLYREDPKTGERLEPIEEVVIDVDEEYSGIVVEALSVRKGRMTEMRQAGGGKVRLTFTVPSRGLIGYHGEFMTETRGTGVLNRVFSEYAPYQGPVPGRRNGVLISNATGKSNAYGLAGLEGRGILLIGATVPVYEGMIVGEHSRENDLEVNPLKAKQLTNVRASGTDEAIRLTPPRRMSLEDAIAYVNDDELLEVTPLNLRLRKRYLDPNVRKREDRKKDAG